MTMASTGRKTRPDGDGAAVAAGTITGNRALMVEEPLIFDLNSPGACGVDLLEPPTTRSRIGDVPLRKGTGLPDMAEPVVVRHYTRLSQKNMSIDTAFYPLGSCTMKHNPRLNEKMARLPGFADVHPLQPVATVQGALELIHTLAGWLMKLTGMAAVAMPPAAGAHGELCGMMAIRKAIEHREGANSPRRRVLVPASAHGTNPATAAALGLEVEALPVRSSGLIDPKVLMAKLGEDTAAIMLTNPNTLGLFLGSIIDMADAAHRAGAYFYCDGANFNAIVGRVRPVDLGIDAMHINLHKTFSTPHGGGGPGSGPVVLSEQLAPFAPLPMVVANPDGSFRLVEHLGADHPNSIGRLKAYHGQMGMFVRAMAYMLSHGADGLRQVAGDAVLSANYILASLKDVLSAPVANGCCMHEALFDDTFLKETGVTTLDFAKAIIDEGIHPMTMYFPQVVHGAMLVEPTETETRATLDNFIAVARALAERALAGDTDYFTGAPRTAPLRRLDETQAARNPILRWTPRDGSAGT